MPAFPAQFINGNFDERRIAEIANDGVVCVPSEKTFSFKNEKENIEAEDPRSVLDILKRLSENSNLSKYVPLLKYLESNLDSTSIVKGDRNVQIRLPNCWNCKNEVCTVHSTNPRV